MTQPDSDKLTSEPAADLSQPDSSSAGQASLGSTAAPPRRRWHQFSLWSLFALVLLAALVLWGWRWTIAPYRAQASTIELVKRLGSSYQLNPAPEWMSRLAGEDLGDVTLVNLADCDEPDEYLRDIAKLPRLEILVVGGEAFTDQHAASLSAIKSLRWLILDSTGISGDALGATNGDLKVYRSQRRLIAALVAAGAVLSSPPSTRARLNSEYRDVMERVGAEFFDEPNYLWANRPIKAALVARLTSLTVLDAYQWLDITDAEAAELARTPNLARLSLDSSKLTDEGVRHLSKMPYLRSIGVSNCRISDAGLALLAQHKELESLSLAGTQISDAGLAHLAGLANLVNLYIDSPMVTDAGIAHLSGLRGLEMLDLRKTQISDAGMAHLRGLNNLIWLNLGATRITGAGLVHLRAMSDLTWLTLDDTRVSDQGLAHLTGLPKLDDLHLRGTEISDDAVDHLAKCPALKVLDVRDARMTSAGVARLKSVRPSCNVSSATAPRKSPLPMKPTMKEPGD